VTVPDRVYDGGVTEHDTATQQATRICTPRDVLADITSRLDAGASVVTVGICGAPGAGKSYMAAALRRALVVQGVSTIVLPMDGFHLSNGQLAQLGLSQRKGAPDTYDVAGFVSLLDRITNRQPADVVYAPEYDRTIHEPIAARVRIGPDTRAVVIEGNFLLLDRPGWRDVKQHLSISWFLDVPAIVREDRLVQRHVDAGRSYDDAVAWVRGVDRPNADMLRRAQAVATFTSRGSFPPKFR